MFELSAARRWLPLRIESHLQSADGPRHESKAVCERKMVPTGKKELSAGGRLFTSGKKSHLQVADGSRNESRVIFRRQIDLSPMRK